MSTKENNSSSAISIIIIGYVFAVLSFLLYPIIFMPLGILCGIVSLAVHSRTTGLWVILFSVCLGFYGASEGGWGFGLPKPNFGTLGNSNNNENDQYTFYFKDKNVEPVEAFTIDDVSYNKFGDTITYSPFGTFNKYYVLKSDLDSIVVTGSIKLDGFSKGTHLNLK